MIPKIIHYCWFGGKKLPKSALKCISSWEKFFPDYEIKEWNETNFDVQAIAYTSQAYRAQKYAFVSDYVRYKVLYEQGGLYFDTDVEVIKSYDDILKRGSFLGFEIDPKSSFKGAVNPGLGMGAEKHLSIYKEILEVYNNHPGFINIDGTFNTEYAVVKITTDNLIRNGLTNCIGIQEVKGIQIYPSDWFNPLDYATGKLVIKPETHSIHWFDNSWNNRNNILTKKLKRFYHRIFNIHSK